MEPDIMSEPVHKPVNYTCLLLLIILVNATGLFGSIMEVDGSLYACIAKHMVQQNDFINLYNNTDWLDKPHFPFWMVACSFKLFGINSFAYKLPAFLFWLAGLGYLYKLGKVLYNRQTAVVAVLVYATALQAVVALSDVRAEHYLTVLTLASIYYLYRFYTTNSLKYVVLAALFSAFAIMTKGIFFLAAIISGQGLLILIKKEWKQFANYRWYLYLLLTLLFIMPELYCLYTQFDLHPEKVVYGKTGVSGLRFFFWDSQFGRFLNTGPIKGKGDPFFFLHTTLWAFLPWSILLYVSVARLIKEKMVLYKSPQWIVIGGTAFTFLIFSLSKFQLPHYIIVLFPQFALLSADYLISKQGLKGMRSFVMIQRLLLAVLLLVITVVCRVYGLPYAGWILLCATIITATAFYVSQGNDLPSVLLLGIGFYVVITLFLNLFFYPSLLGYQSGETAAEWLNANKKPSTIYILKQENFSLKFYTTGKAVCTDTLLPKPIAGSAPDYYFTKKKIADSLLLAGLPVTELQSFPDFHISKVNARFLYKSSRASQVDTNVIFTLTAGN